MTDWKPGDQNRRRGYDSIDIAKTAAEIAARIVADTAKAANGTLALDLKYMKDDITEIKLLLESKYITKENFSPVKQIVYSLVALILVAFVGALITIVLK